MTSVIGRLEGDIGRIILNRPRALNALTTEMVETIDGALATWQDLELRAVVIDSSTDNFCAGGDVRRLRDLALDGDWDQIEHFLRSEYRMNERIATYPTPVVSLIDGVCMGGGMGVSMHGTFRVVTERAVLAMPETVIGFIPDVGSTYFLSRLPGAVGQYLGLTGYRMTAADALHVGLATHVVSSARLGRLAEAIATTDLPLSVVLDTHASGASSPSELEAARTEIDLAFSAPDVGGILTRLSALSSPWARTTEAALKAASPLSLVTTHDLIERGRERTLTECLDAELTAAMELVRVPDFVEGVRAGLVDKDRRPSWSSTL